MKLFLFFFIFGLFNYIACDGTEKEQDELNVEAERVINQNVIPELSNLFEEYSLLLEDARGSEEITELDKNLLETIDKSPEVAPIRSQVKDPECTNVYLLSRSEAFNKISIIQILISAIKDLKKLQNAAISLDHSVKYYSLCGDRDEACWEILETLLRGMDVHFTKITKLKAKVEHFKKNPSALIESEHTQKVLRKYLINPVSTCLEKITPSKE